MDTTKGIITRDLYESGHVDLPDNICPDQGETIKLLIIITSAPPHRDMRLAIRQTWGHFSKRRDIKIAFLLGLSNEMDDEKIQAESFMYNDIIIGKFIDCKIFSFYNIRSLLSAFEPLSDFYQPSLQN